MKIYVAMISDRHDDPEPHLFSAPEPAIAYAQAEAVRLAGRPLFIEEAEVDGWLYSATCGSEGDSVWVVERELDGGTGD